MEGLEISSFYEVVFISGERWDVVCAWCQPPLKSLKHHIKTRTLGEDGGALNLSVHLCKLQLPWHVLPMLHASPQVFPQLLGKGPLLEFGGATGRCGGCIGCTPVDGGEVRSSKWLVCKGVCSVPGTLSLHESLHHQFAPVAI